MRRGLDPQVFAREVAEHLRALLLAQTVGEAAEELLECTPEDAQRYREQAGSAVREQLFRLMELFMRVEPDMKWAADPRAMLELTAVRACCPEGEKDVSLAERVGHLEAAIERGAVAAPAKEAPKPAKAPAPAKAGVTPIELVGGAAVIALAGGSDGKVANVSPNVYMGEDNGPGKRSGLAAFLENVDVSIMAIPGVTAPEVQAALIAHCENCKSCFAILDVPIDRKKTNDVVEFRDMYDTTYAAMYHPWLEMFDPLAKRSAYFPPSGAMAGIYARTDNERGVHKAPANEIVRGCTGLSCNYNEGEQDILNPKGVNLIRAFTGRGIRVWGARTMSSNGLWKYVNVRRLYIYIEESIKANTNWVVFEPNSEVLWGRVTRTIEMFLATCWRSGALAGSTPSEAYFVECGPTTMTQDDIDNGRLICNIGIAAVKPAEFVIFRITQHTASSESEG